MQVIAMMSPFPAGWGIQSDYNYPINGKYWAAADYDVTLVNLVTMKIERRINLLDFATTYPASPWRYLRKVHALRRHHDLRWRCSSIRWSVTETMPWPYPVF
jgi:hypothetical protein